jgi:hypothetical protein
VYGNAEDAPVAFVTVTGAEPAEPAGMTATIVVSPRTTQDAALTAPNLTPVVATVPVKYWPTIVT